MFFTLQPATPGEALSSPVSQNRHRVPKLWVYLRSISKTISGLTLGPISRLHHVWVLVERAKVLRCPALPSTPRHAVPVVSGRGQCASAGSRAPIPAGDKSGKGALGARGVDFRLLSDHFRKAMAPRTVPEAERSLCTLGEERGVLDIGPNHCA